jgi:hypothetical protein
MPFRQIAFRRRYFIISLPLFAAIIIDIFAPLKAIIDYAFAAITPLIFRHYAFAIAAADADTPLLIAMLLISLLLFDISAAEADYFRHFHFRHY